MKKSPGQSLTEYGLIMSLVAMLCLPALFLLKDAIGASLEAMLPPAKTSNPALANAPANGNVQNPSSGVPVGNGGGNITVVAGAGTNTNVGAAEQISTAGANGNSATVLGNSAKIEALAAKYSQTAPELSNSIIQLGQLGQQMGQAIANNNRSATMQIWGRFTDLYSKIQTLPNGYGQLKPEDQALINTLTNQSAQLSAAFAGFTYAGSGGLQDYKSLTLETVGVAGTQVQSNSNQTVQCGQNLKCN